jgi:hypothetical protein
MHFLLGTKAKDTPGPDVTIDCLWCGRQGTTAHSRKRTEWLTLFHLLPLFPFHTVFVRCDSCQQDMIAKCSLEELTQSNPLTLKHLLVKRVSFVGKVCIVLGLLLCWAPPVGWIPAIIGFIYGRKYGCWMKKWGGCGLILNLFSPLIAMVVILVVQHFSK